MFDVGSVVAHIKADLTGFNQGIDEAKSKLGGLRGHVTEFGDELRGFGQRAAIVGLAVAGGFALIGKSALSAAGDMEQNATAFRTMLGNAEEAAKLLKDLSTFARQTPFTLPDVVTGAKQLLAYGFTADKIIDTTRMLGDVSAGLKVPLGDMVYLYGTLRAQGRAYTKDLNQFMNRGIPVIEELAKKFGVTTEQIYKMTEAGQIGFKDIESVFKGLTNEGGKFHKMMAEQATTLGGVFSNVQDGLTRAALAFFGWNEETARFNKGSIFETIKGFSIALQGFVENVGPELEKIGKKITDTFGQMLLTLTPVGKWIIDNQALVITFFKGLGIAVSTLLVLATVAGVLSFILNPLTLVAAAITALYVAWETNFYGFRDITQKVINEVVGFFNTYLVPMLKDFQKIWKTLWPSISLTLKGAWDIMAGIVKLVWNTIYGFLKAGLALLRGDWEGMWTALALLQENGWNAIKKIFQGALEFVLGWGGGILTAIVSPFENAKKRVEETINWIKDKLDFTHRESPSIIDIINRGVKLANKAFGDLQFNANFTPQAAAAVVSNGNGGINAVSINIDLAGAFIGDEAAAVAMGERVGDSIIKKLQANVRF